MPVTWAEVQKEFDESLGYIHNDIEAICAGTQTLNYTVALLAGIACEALEDARAYANKVTVLEELLPDPDWKKLAGPLFEALRHGLAHNFDTKHIHVNGKTLQIYLSWSMQEMIRIKPANWRRWIVGKHTSTWSGRVPENTGFQNQAAKRSRGVPPLQGVIGFWPQRQVRLSFVEYS